MEQPTVKGTAPTGRGCRVLTGLVAMVSATLLAGMAAAAGYVSHPAAIQMIDELVETDGFSRGELELLLGQARRQESIIEAISRPAEKTRPWHEYRDIFVTASRARQGVAFHNRYADSLRRAEREYGVPAAMIVAVIGVETRYGRNMGSYRVIDALATLAFDYPPRSSFFSGELKHFLILSRQQGLPTTELKGSYAGAMGYGQFIPSSYRNFAIDFDGDGVADIWENPVDAIGSVANYFRHHGWRSGEAVASPARVETGYRKDLTNAGLKPELTVADFIAAKIIPTRELPAAALATAMEFEGASGMEHWLGLHNFYVITRYNHSAMYAMSVYHLSQDIEAALN